MQHPQPSPTHPDAINDLQRLQMFVNLIPVLGMVPALWTLYQGNPRSPLRSVSRLAVVLGLSWLTATLLLGAGASAHLSTTTTLRFLLGSSFVGSGYFLVMVWLMLRIAQRKSVRLPGFSQLSRRLP
jgi:hypothetical protein